MEYGDSAGDLYNRSTKEKLKLLYEKKENISKFKSITIDSAFKKYSIIENVRHEMIHYKVSTKEHASRLADFKIMNAYASTFFTKTSLSEGRDDTVKIAKRIAEDLGYGIKEDMDIVSCDGNGPIYNYVYDLHMPFI